MMNDQQVVRTMAQLDDETAFKTQQEELQMLNDNEDQQALLRYEWRKMLENSYDADIIDHERKAKVDHVDVITGPTSINVLGTHYQQQLANQKVADQRMADHAARVAVEINAPSRM